MKSGQRLVLLLIIFGLFVFAACTPDVVEDPVAEAYTALNNTESASGKTYLEVNLPDDHVFQEASEDAILKLLETGTGVVYFGFPACPWCRAAITVMNDAAQQVNLDVIYSVDVYEHRDIKERNAEGAIVTTQEGSEFYANLLRILGDNAPQYSGLDDPSERRIHTPLVVVVVDGQIVATHLSTVASQEDPYLPMTAEQYDELLNIYKAMFIEIPGCEDGGYVC